MGTEMIGDDAAFEAELRAAMPKLLAQCRKLCSGRPSEGEEVYSTVLLLAWSNRDKYTLGTNMPGWLWMIARNEVGTMWRRLAREVFDPDGEIARATLVSGGQFERVMLRELSDAIAALPIEKGQTLLLIAGEGVEYEDAAVLTGVSSGTIKSRVNRARRDLAAYAL